MKTNIVDAKNLHFIGGAKNRPAMIFNSTTNLTIKIY